MKKLYRSRENKMIAGICGGMGEYADVDPTLIRLFSLFFWVITGIVPMTLAYLVAIYVIPEKPIAEV